MFTSLVSGIAWGIGAILLYRFLRFISTPLLFKVGFYRYHSSLFFTLPLAPRLREIHLGTSYDFFRAEKKCSRSVLGLLSQGLKNLCDEIRSNKVSKDTLLKGTLYYFNHETLLRFGFQTRRLKWYEYIFFGLNYIELCTLFSLTKRRLTCIPFHQVKVAYARAGDLLNYAATYDHYSSLLLNAKKKTPVTLISTKEVSLPHFPSSSLVQRVS